MKRQWVEISDIYKLDESNYKDYLGCVYAIEYDEYLKIGSTKNPVQRIKNVIAQGKNYSTAEYSAMLISLPHTNYKENEFIIHKHFEIQRVTRGELFKLTIRDFIEQCPLLIFKDESEQMEKRSEEVIENMVNLCLGGRWHE